MLTYLSTDPKIRVMEKIIKRLEKQTKGLQKLNIEKLRKMYNKYNVMKKRYEQKIIHHAQKIIKNVPPSKVNCNVAGVVAYVEVRKKLLKSMHRIKLLIKTKKSRKFRNTKGIRKYLK